MQKILPSIDLERSELRYVFYIRDLPAIVKDIKKIGFVEKVFPDSPVTKTVYFGSRMGVRPGISIKGRIYDKFREDNTIHFLKNSIFNVLEIKSTLNHDEMFFHGFSQPHSTDQKFISSYLGAQDDIIYRIQRASEDGLLHQSTFKTKSRLRKEDISEEITSNLTLNEIVTLLCIPSELDQRLSSELRSLLNRQIRTIHQKTLVPYLMTQYSRIHFIPEKPEWKQFIRITIDPGVEYYSLNFKNKNDFIEQPEIIGEFLERENFCRLEFKVDPTRMKQEKNLNSPISDLLRKYGCLAFISKKWRGTTLVSDSYIQNQMLWTNPNSKHISGFFPVNRSWYQYGNITGYLYKLIRSSKKFSLYDEDARMLIKNENYVSGYVGFPNPSMVVRIHGPQVQYFLPPKNRPIKTKYPEFYITEHYNHPLRTAVVKTYRNLNEFILPSTTIDGYAFFRSYGFLVKHSYSDRVYKLTIEKYQKTQENEVRSELYCKMRYIGAKNTLNFDNTKDIYSELTEFYNEFAPIMINPIELGEEDLELIDDELMEFIS